MGGRPGEIKIMDYKEGREKRRGRGHLGEYKGGDGVIGPHKESQ